MNVLVLSAYMCGVFACSLGTSSRSNVNSKKPFREYECLQLSLNGFFELENSGPVSPMTDSIPNAIKKSEIVAVKDDPIPPFYQMAEDELAICGYDSNWWQYSPFPMHSYVLAMINCSRMRMTSMRDPQAMLLGLSIIAMRDKNLHNVDAQIIMDTLISHQDPLFNAIGHYIWWVGIGVTPKPFKLPFVPAFYEDMNYLNIPDIYKLTDQEYPFSQILDHENGYWFGVKSLKAPEEFCHFYLNKNNAFVVKRQPENYDMTIAHRVIETGKVNYYTITKGTFNELLIPNVQLGDEFVLCSAIVPAEQIPSADNARQWYYSLKYDQMSQLGVLFAIRIVTFAPSAPNHPINAIPTALSTREINYVQEAVLDPIDCQPLEYRGFKEYRSVYQRDQKAHDLTLLSTREKFEIFIKNLRKNKLTSKAIPPFYNGLVQWILNSQKVAEWEWLDSPKPLQSLFVAAVNTLRFQQITLRLDIPDYIWTSLVFLLKEPSVDAPFVLAPLLSKFDSSFYFIWLTLSKFIPPTLRLSSTFFPTIPSTSEFKGDFPGTLQLARLVDYEIENYLMDREVAVWIGSVGDKTSFVYKSDFSNNQVSVSIQRTILTSNLTISFQKKSGQIIVIELGSDSPATLYCDDGEVFWISNESEQVKTAPPSDMSKVMEWWKSQTQVPLTVFFYGLVTIP